MKEGDKTDAHSQNQDESFEEDPEHSDITNLNHSFRKQAVTESKQL